MSAPPEMDVPPAFAVGAEFDRTPPHNLEAELIVLGAMMYGSGAVAAIVETGLGPMDHYRPAHQMIHAAILGLYGRGEPPDSVAVAEELFKAGELARCGGAPYLHTCMASVPTAANGPYYARMVREKAVLRRLIEAGTRTVQLGYESGDGQLEDTVARAGLEFDKIAAQVDTGSLEVVQPYLADALEAMTERPDPRDGLWTGFVDLDNLTSGLKPGQMVVIAARPAMGKSTLLLDICRHAAIDGGKTVALFSLEMSRREIIARLLCAQARVPLFSAQHQTLTDADLHRLSRVMADVAEAPLLIDDTPGLSLPQIRAALMKHVRSGRPLHLAAIDYAQLVTPTGRSTSRNREQEVSEMSRGIKLLGKEFGIPVILCAQLNRGPEQRADKRPVLADLRESGSIEQDADIVILLFREDAYERESPNAGVCDFIVAKHRNGPTAVLQVASQLHYARFADMARI